MTSLSRALLIAIAIAPSLAAQGSDIVHEASIEDLQAMMASKRTTSVALVDAYLARIAAYDGRGPRLNALIRLNPRAHTDAAALDRERRAGRVRGPLHGIPIILKDNYNTRDMPTSGSSIALASLQSPDDAFQVARLRDAGAVILGKSNLHELAAGITSISSLGGQTCNPYDIGRAPGGSSGGTGAAVAASFSAIAWGSDTCGSIRIPAAVHNLFGLRSTKGLSSITGIVPLSHTQDVGGPLARTVMDLAIGLDATVGPDPADAATRLLDGRAPQRFVASLDSTSLTGTRIGVLTSLFGEETDDAEGARIVRAALDRMKSRGAEIIDVAVPGLDSVVARAAVIDYEFKYDLLDYLASIPNAPVKSLAEILDRGLYHTALDGPFRRRETMGTRDGADYRAALGRRTIARDMLVAFMDTNRIDAIAYPALRRKAAILGEAQRGTTCQLSAVTGLPAIAIPAGFTPDGMPIGVELLGRQLSDTRLVSYAYDYERAFRPRRAPTFTPPLVGGRAPTPMAYSAAVTAAGASARTTFRYEPQRRTLAYAARVSNAARVEMLSLSRDSAGRAGPVVHRLPVGTGVIQLTASDERDLMAGRLVLVMHAGAQTQRAPLAPQRATR